jgi:hypothetical protein
VRLPPPLGVFRGVVVTVILALGSTLLLPLILYLKPPYPLIYALLTPILVLLLLLANPPGFKLFTLVMLGFSFIQFTLGVTLFLEGFRGYGLELFIILTLTTYTLIVFSLVNPKVSYGWIIFGFIVILWVLESRHIMVLGLPQGSIIGRAHIIAIAIVALLLAYVKPLNRMLWRIRVLIGIVTPLLILCFIQVGLVAEDVYEGVPGSEVALIYIPVIVLAILSVKVNVCSGRYSLEDVLVYTGLLLAYIISLIVLTLEVLGFQEPELIASMLEGIAWLVAPMIILWTGVLAGSRLASIGAVILVVITQHLTPIVIGLQDTMVKMLSYTVALTAIMVAARREAKLYVPPLITLIIAPLVLTGVADYTINNYSMLVPLDSSRRVEQLYIEIGKPENVSITNNVISMLIPLTINYEGLKFNKTLELKYLYDEEEGFITKIDREHRVEVEDKIMKVRIEIAPTLIATLQTLYLASLILKEPRLDIRGSLILEIKVYENINTVNMKQLLLLTPSVIAVLLEFKPKITKHLTRTLRKLKSTVKFKH